MAEHVGAVDVEVLEQGDHVVDELRQGVGVVRRTRSTGAAVVEADHPVVFAQGWDLETPILLVGAEAADEHQRLALT